MTDIGAIDPGGFSPSARDNYQEGFQSKGLKLVEGGRMRRDVLDTFLNMVRDPGMTQLDLKSQLAANHVAKQRMLELYADYGADVVEAVSEELIRQSEQLVREPALRAARRRVARAEYIDMPGANATVELTAIKEGDTLTYDFTGSSPQAELGVNCSYWATWGGLFAPIFPLARLGRDLERGCHAADRADRARGDDRQLRAAGADLDRHGGDDPDRQQPLDARALEDVRRERALREPRHRGLARQPRARRDARPPRRRASSSSPR